MSMAKTSFDFSRMTDEEVKILDGIVEKLPKLSKYALKYLYREVKCHYFMEHDLYHVEIDDEESIRRRKAAGENLDCPSPIRFADGLIKEKEAADNNNTSK